MAMILSLNSHVAYGHVGGQAAVPVWHEMGHEVCHVPTVIFSNHPGHNGFEGDVIDLALQNRLVDGLSDRGFLSQCDALHTGYLGQAGSADVALRAASMANDTVFLCDPVLGDHDSLYVAPDVAKATRDKLIPQAKLVTPNRFELAWLSGRTVSNLEDAIAAAQALRLQGPECVICTSAHQSDDWLYNIAVTPNGVFHVKVPYIGETTAVPKGTGDAFAAVLLGHYLQHGEIPAAMAGASAVLHDLIRASLDAGSDELAVVAARKNITSPKQQYAVEKIA